MIRATMPERYRAIVAEVAGRYGLAPEVMFRRGRKDPLTSARREALAEIRATPKLNGKLPSYPEIGAWVGRDHSSVFAAVKAHEAARAAMEGGAGVYAAMRALGELRRAA